MNRTRRRDKTIGLTIPPPLVPALARTIKVSPGVFAVFIVPKNLLRRVSPGEIVGVKGIRRVVVRVEERPLWDIGFSDALDAGAGKLDNEWLTLHYPQWAAAKADWAYDCKASGRLLPPPQAPEAIDCLRRLYIQDGHTLDTPFWVIRTALLPVKTEEEKR